MPSPSPRAWPAVARWAAFVYGALGVAYLLAKSALNAAPEIDFKYLWFAGRMWLDGRNPYGEEFVVDGAQWFVGTNVLQGWSYPPNWWAISCFHALFSVEAATAIWRSFNAVLVIGGSALLFAAHRRAHPHAPWAVFALLLGFAATLQATAMTLALGQTSIVTFFGLCALSYGVSRGPLRGAPWIQALGLTLLMLKPQVGVIAAAAMLAHPRYWRAVGLAALASLALAAPALLSVGVRETLLGMLRNLSEHDRLSIFSPPETTGVRHLVHALSGATLPGFVAFAGAALVFALVAFTRSRGRWNGESAALLMAAILGPTLFAAPLHSYDMVIAAPLALVLLEPGRNGSRLALGAGLLVLYRATNVAQLTGWVHPDSSVFAGSWLESLAALAITGAAALWMTRRSSESTGDAERGHLAHAP
jgi:hypothetical protein